jgi:hypothetical protein
MEKIRIDDVTILTTTDMAVCEIDGSYWIHKVKSMMIRKYGKMAMKECSLFLSIGDQKGLG